MRVVIRVMAVALCVAAWGNSENLLTNPGFENGNEGWTQHYRATVEFAIDDTVAHTGNHSARCSVAAATDRAGFTQRLNLRQDRQTPLLVSLWYRTQEVTGPQHRSFALVLAVEYTTDTDPEHTDDAFIFPLATGTNEWTHLSEVVVPRAPIDYMHFHVEMKNRTGTAWFDDLQLSVLAEAPLVGRPEELAPWRWEELPAGFAAALRSPQPEAMVLFAQPLHTQDYHRDPLRLLLNYRERHADAAQPALIVEPPGWVSVLAGEPLNPPYVHVCFRRRWDELSLLVEAQGREGMHTDLWLALPEGLYAVRSRFEGWEPEFDAIRAGRVNGRVVLHAVPETASGRDAVEFALTEVGRELPPPKPAVVPPEAPEVTTNDGLALHFADGRPVALSLDGQPLPAAEVGGEGLQGTGGFYVGVLLQGEFRPVVGGGSAVEGGYEQRVELAGMDLRFIARYRSAGDHITVEGQLRDTSGRDRAIDLVFKLPARCDGWTWASSLYDTQPIAEEGLYTTDYPIAAVADGERGLAMALLPDRPARASFGYDPRSALFHVRYRCGLTGEMSGPLRSAHPFAFTIERCDGAWGWRDALERFQARHPRYFAPRCPVFGKWLFQTRPDRLPNPEQFAYDEGSYQFELDDQFGVGSYPYLIPGQREIKRLEALPRSYEEAMTAFEAYQPPSANAIQEARGWGSALKTIIGNCATTGPDGRRHISIRSTPWGGASVTFFLNMDPDLFGDEGGPGKTIGATVLRHVADLMETEPSLDGVYLDSWSSWGAAVDNHRRDHFPWAAYPASYDAQTGAVCLVGQWSALEFLNALNEMLHPTGRYVLANMGARVHPFSCMALDIVGVEGGTRPGRAQVEEFRPVTGRKQLCVLEHVEFLGGEDGVISRAEYDDYAKRCLAVGAIPSVTWFDGYPALYEANRDLFDRYYALAMRLARAGWHAVTGARADQPQVHVERFGPEEPAGGSGPGTVLLTVWNPEDEPCAVTVSIDAATLGLPEDMTVIRLIGGGTVPVDDLRLELDARGLEVLELRAP